VIAISYSSASTSTAVARPDTMLRRA